MAEILPIRPATGPAEDDTPPAPDRLSEEAARIWDSIVSGWHLHDDALPLLALGVEAFDRYREAAEILRRDGPTITNPKSGAVRAHPCHAIARDNLTAVRQCFRQLGLEPPKVVS